MHAMGFFMKRGIKLFGWVLILAGMSLYIAHNLPFYVDRIPDPAPYRKAHLQKAALYAGKHLANGINQYFTEEKPDGHDPDEEGPDEK